NVPDALRRLPQRPAQPRVAVAECADRDAGEQVPIGAALGVEETGAPAPARMKGRARVRPGDGGGLAGLHLRRRLRRGEHGSLPFRPRAPPAAATVPRRRLPRRPPPPPPDT